MAPDPKLIEKLKKLFAYQEDSEKRNSLAEAANAAQRIQDLLIKHNLSMSDVEGRINQPYDIEVERVMLNTSDYGYNKRYGKYMEQLMGSLCKYNLCRLILHGNGKADPTFAIIGRPENVEIVKFLFDQILAKARGSERYEYARYTGPEQHGMWRRGYLMGFAMGIGAKLREQMEAMGKTQDPLSDAISRRMGETSNPITALVRVHEQAVQNFIDNNYRNLGKARKNGNSSHAVSLGFQNGKNTQLNKGIESNAVNQRMLS